MEESSSSSLPPDQKAKSGVPRSTKNRIVVVDVTHEKPLSIAIIGGVRSPLVDSEAMDKMDMNE